METRQLRFARFMEKYGIRGITSVELSRQGFLRYSHYVKVCRDQYDMNILTERMYLPNGRATNVYKYTLIKEKKTSWWSLKKGK